MAEFAQRGPEEQALATRRTQRENVRRGLFALGVAMLAVALAFQFGWRGRNPQMPATCATGYAAARNATDTAIVDARSFQERTIQPRTCGTVRRLLDHRQN